jgi:hypothetical protein
MAAWGRIRIREWPLSRIRGIGARIGDQLDLSPPEAAISSLPLVTSAVHNRSAAPDRAAMLAPAPIIATWLFATYHSRYRSLSKLYC